MSNVSTCIDSSRPRSEEDDKILEEKFAALDEARKYLFDPVTGKFRTMAEAREEANKNEPIHSL